jgi:hypothetical protein
MRRCDLRAKTEAADLALRRVAGILLNREFPDKVEGMGWDGDLAEIRNDTIEFICSPVLPDLTGLTGLRLHGAQSSAGRLHRSYVSHSC